MHKQHFSENVSACGPPGGNFIVLPGLKNPTMLCFTQIIQCFQGTPFVLCLDFWFGGLHRLHQGFDKGPVSQSHRSSDGCTPVSWS